MQSEFEALCAYTRKVEKKNAALRDRVRKYKKVIHDHELLFEYLDAITSARERLKILRCRDNKPDAEEIDRQFSFGSLPILNPIDFDKYRRIGFRFTDD